MLEATLKSFHALNTSESWRSPLSVIAHIDLDAFYAQCQAVYFHIDPDKPLACRQWDSIIAVNYPARKYGIKRGMPVERVRELCPAIELPHVATFKKGCTSWTLEARPDATTHKISLDFFRRESRKIFAIFRKKLQKVEKAGIDEGFIDLGPEVYHKALEMYPELSPVTGNLPESPEQSWKDILLDIGASIISEVRDTIFRELNYTCSAGIASNKLLAKLASAYNKPKQQTVVHDTYDFLDKHRFTDIWGWGGKRGQYVLDTLNTDDNPASLRNLKLDTLLEKLEDPSLARNVYETVRGEHATEVTSRISIKSMASVKNFGGKPVTTMDDLNDWLKVFCADLAGRLEDLSIEDPNNHKFRPKVVSIRYNGGVSRSVTSKQTQCTLNVTKNVTDELLRIARSLLPDPRRILPCYMAALEASNIEVQQTHEFFKPIPKDQQPQDDEESSLFVEPTYICTKCQKTVKEYKKMEHDDWHFALELSKESPREASSPKRQKKAQGHITDFFGKSK